MAPPSSAPPPPVSLDAFNTVLAQVGERLGTALGPLDAGGFVEIRCGDVRIGVNASSTHGTVQLVAPVMPLPSTPAPHFYRRLLELNFLSTGFGAFAVDTLRDTLYLRGMRPLQGLSSAVLHALLLGMAASTERMQSLLAEEFPDESGREL